MNSSLRILIVGPWIWPWYQEACARALESLGCHVKRFEWFSDFFCWQADRIEPVYKTKWAAIQNRFLIGPAVGRINQRLIQHVQLSCPDVIWLYNSTHIYAKTVRILKHLFPSTLLVQYANDNPFGSHVKPDYWRYLKQAIPFFDLHFVYRKSNEVDFRGAGARSVHLLRSYYIPEEDYRVPVGECEHRFRSDVVFAGHYEADGRLEMLESIACLGYRLHLFGGGWKRAETLLSSYSSLRVQFPIEPVLGENYRKAISGAKIALCFLSKVNVDTYTRRNFQIPAMKTLMLSEYSEELAALFKEGIEADFFRSSEELLEKVAFYLRHDEVRERIAQCGYQRVVKDGHDVKSRMRRFLEIVKNEMSERK